MQVKRDSRVVKAMKAGCRKGRRLFRTGHFRARICKVLLPPSIALEDWIERRIGAEALRLGAKIVLASAEWAGCC